MTLWPTTPPPVCLLPLNNKASNKKPVHNSLPIPYAYVQPLSMRPSSYAPVYSDVEPHNYRPSSAWNTEYFAPTPKHYAYAATSLADDSFKGNGILKHQKEENNNEVSRKAKKKQMSLTWGPQKLKQKPFSGKSVKFSASTWGPASPAPAQPRDGEYATINPRKLTSRYVRPAVFRRTTLKE